MSPTTLLFDLDDTVISAYSRSELAWLGVAYEFAEVLFPNTPEDISQSIAAYGLDYWSDHERARKGRRNLTLARREIVTGAFEKLLELGRPSPSPKIIEQLSDRFTAYREEHMCLFPDTHAVVDELKRRGYQLGLITNGSSAVQRNKIERFNLSESFHYVQIEEEVGFGKPDERAYLQALRTLGARVDETWMIGDNLTWEVEVPQRLGIHAVWYDPLNDGLPPTSNVQPDLIVRSLSSLLSHLPDRVFPDDGRRAAG